MCETCVSNKTNDGRDGQSGKTSCRLPLGSLPTGAHTSVQLGSPPFYVPQELTPPRTLAPSIRVVVTEDGTPQALLLSGWPLTLLSCKAMMLAVEASEISTLRFNNAGLTDEHIAMIIDSFSVGPPSPPSPPPPFFHASRPSILPTTVVDLVRRPDPLLQTKGPSTSHVKLPSHACRRTTRSGNCTSTTIAQRMESRSTCSPG